MALLSRFPLIPFLVAAYLGYSGTRKKSLSPSGGLAAFVVGFSMMAVPLRTFGVSLIVFYLAGSRATKVGKARKAALEEGHQEAGYRGAAQVLCNSLSALVASLVWSAAFVPGSFASALLSGFIPQNSPYDFNTWCPIAPPASSKLSRTLLLVTLGHFACCLGDTLASELGILSPSQPRLVTTWKPVPPGTNGGMSPTGTLASLMGGVIMGATLSATLLVESAACRTQWHSVVLPLLAYGALGGVFGSFIDSLMGATIQQTRYSTSTKRVLTDESGEPVAGTELKVISGVDVLTNNQVNLLSSILTSLFIGYLA
ncbi:hypothetical protein PHLGIDRAFT_109362 [Phlebiopsis gigantea 11061_1 CR5-6]|uniref:Transmembrane protein 19 n=1 Tax=Phlebiopsis gigantea (strain 11061_1 CR5-6) TaxID=745531 RepID=A0A0C3RUC5_PHLG1|nr:hypothetical protein PHLGIDRAFT_109362 [Phlebiopsis gigantea 11061_1 CR5-6]